MFVVEQPNDRTGRQYHVVNLEGQPVLVYRDVRAAISSMEGDQRLFIYDEVNHKWIGASPAPEAVVAIERMKHPINHLAHACLRAYDALDSLDEHNWKIKVDLEQSARELLRVYNTIDRVKS